MPSYEANWNALEAIIPSDALRARKLVDLAESSAKRGEPLDQASRDLRRRLWEDLHGSWQSASGETDRILKKLSPRAALRLSARSAVLASEVELSILTQHAGLNRFIWVVAAGGGGEEETDELLARYIHSVARWCALNFIVSLLRDIDDDVPTAVAVNPDLEQLRRHMSTEIRFAWVSRLIASTAANIVQSDAERFGVMSEILTSRAVDELFDYVGAYAFAPSYWIFLSGAESLGKESQALMRAMGVEAGSLSSLKFADLALGVEAEIFPFVNFGQLSLPLAIREAALGIEHAIFEMARRLLSQPEARGELFELVVSAALSDVLPDSFSAFGPPIHVPISDDDPGEIDFAISSPEGLLLVGEAKAYLIARRADSVINAFGGQLAKASNQLRKRLDAIYAGELITTGRSDEGIAPVGVSRGIGVPMHSYATAIWNRQALELIDALHEDIAILPLHQLILVASVMSDAADFRSYLDVRWKLIEGGMHVFDEADMLLGFVSGRFDDVQEILTAMSYGEGTSTFMLEGAWVDPRASFLLSRPRSAPLWKVTFMKVCRTSSGVAT